MTEPAPSLDDLVTEDVPDFRASADADINGESSEVGEPTRTTSTESFAHLLGRGPRTGARKTPGMGKAKADKPKAEDIPMPRGPRGFEPAIEKAYQTIGMGLMLWDPDVATTVIEIAPEAAKALNELAKTNPAFRKFLVNMTKTTAIGAVFAAHLPLIMVLTSKAMGDKPTPVFNITDLQGDVA